jgi:hypothetical protein
VSAYEHTVIKEPLGEPAQSASFLPPPERVVLG